MSEHILAFLLITSSSKGANVVFSWPPVPERKPRFCRPRTSPQLDNAVRGISIFSAATPPPVFDKDLLWKAPQAIPKEFADARHPSSRANSFAEDSRPVFPRQYDEILGYGPEILGNILCPPLSSCFQKFELVLDDLAFVGHPVCADADGKWRSKHSNRGKHEARGRDTRQQHQMHHTESTSREGDALPRSKETSWLGAFNLCAVIDLPDPSSASDNVAKYFEVVYQQLVFTLTAVLFQEQVTSNFVETECDILGSLRDAHISKHEPFQKYAEETLRASSLANSLRTLYDAIRASKIAHMTINNLPLELQLPPMLDQILRGEEDSEVSAAAAFKNDGYMWGPDLTYGWNLPQLAPWKSLLLLDGPLSDDALSSLKHPQPNAEEQAQVDGLVRFLDAAKVGVSLADIATLLDWDLENQVYVAVRWLVLHRRAKVCDVIHSELKTVFALPHRLSAPISVLAEDFDEKFGAMQIPPLTQILSEISTSPSKHFYDAVVHRKDLLPLYHDVVEWMLKRDLLVTQHVHIRLVATKELKARVRSSRTYSKSLHRTNVGDDSSNWVSLSPKTARNRRYSIERRMGIHTQPVMFGDDATFDEELREEDEYLQDEDSNLDHELMSSIICDPGRATPLERKWIEAMSEGKDAKIAKRFGQINQYFDGKSTDDEILLRGEISRKQLREVLQQYEEYIQTFLHAA